MSRLSLLKFSPLALVLFLPLGWTAAPKPAPEFAGPPWLSLEAPANPMDPTTRDAAFLVHAYHHGQIAAYPVSGTAEGLVDGRRRTIQLDVQKTSRDGVYAVRANWPAEGSWVLKMTTVDDGVTLVAELGPDGGLGVEPFYNGDSKTLSLASVRVVKGRISADKVDTALQAMAARTD